MRWGVHMTPRPSKIVLRWAFWLFFLKPREKSKLYAWFLARFLCCSLTSYFKNKLFFWGEGGTTTSSGPCSSASTCSKFFIYVGSLVRVRIFMLVLVWGQYLLSTLSHGFFKNDSLLHCCSGPKWIKKQDLPLPKIARTWRTNQLKVWERYQTKGFFMLYKLSITSFLYLY